MALRARLSSAPLNASNLVMIGLEALVVAGLADDQRCRDDRALGNFEGQPALALEYTFHVKQRRAAGSSTADKRPTTKLWSQSASALERVARKLTLTLAFGVSPRA